MIELSLQQCFYNVIVRGTQYVHSKCNVLGNSRIRPRLFPVKKLVSGAKSKLNS